MPRFPGTSRGALLALLLPLLAAQVACPMWWERGDREYRDLLADGTYQASGLLGGGVLPAELQGVTARLDRAAGQLTITRSDGSAVVEAFRPRPAEGWREDCYTMASHHLGEVADLSPEPLEAVALRLATPVVYAACWDGRMILAGDLTGLGSGLVLDLVPLP